MAQTEFKRQIGLFDAVMLISGDMIGTGIFISTGAIAETLPTPGGVSAGVAFRRASRSRRGAHLCRAVREPALRGWRLHLYSRSLRQVNGILVRLVFVSCNILRRDCVSRRDFEWVHVFLFSDLGLRTCYFFARLAVRSDHRQGGYNIFHRCGAAFIGIALLGCPSRYVDAERADDSQNWRAFRNHSIRGSFR